MIITVICTGSSAHELSQATIRIRTIYGEGEIRGKAGRRFEWDRQQENRSHKACRTHTSYNMYMYTYIYIYSMVASKYHVEIAAGIHPKKVCT